MLGVYRQVVVSEAEREDRDAKRHIYIAVLIHAMMIYRKCLPKIKICMVGRYRNHPVSQ